MRRRKLLLGLLVLAVLAVVLILVLRGCGKDKEPAVDLTQYAVKEAAYPAYPAEPRFEDYFDENGEGANRTHGGGQRTASGHSLF